MISLRALAVTGFCLVALAESAFAAGATDTPPADERAQVPVATPTRVPSAPPFYKRAKKTISGAVDTVVDGAKQIVPDVEPPLARASRVRTITVGGTLSFLGLPIPFKWGPFLSYLGSDEWTFELSSISGSYGLTQSFLNLGGFNESLLALNARRTYHNSFSWIIGISRQSYDATLGSALVSHATGTAADIEFMHTKTIGLQLGMGNRWQWENGIVFGVDWLTLNIPFMTISSSSPILDDNLSSEDRSQVDGFMKVMRNTPTAILGRVSLGYAF